VGAQVPLRAMTGTGTCLSTFRETGPKW
jgi:hypothetical protein